MNSEQRNANKKGFVPDQSSEALAVTPINKGNVTMSSLALNFNNVQFDVVDHNNQPWLRVHQIGVALGYSRPDAVNKVYQSNADEFTDSMTALVEVDTAGGKQKVRIFSLRGCHLLAMFARTAIAKQFRKWVLDILDKEVTNQVINPRTTITPEQQAILHSIVDRRVNGFDSLRGGLWKRHNRHFGIAKYSQLLASRFDDAVVYLETAELRYPKPKEKINDGCYFLMAKDGVVIYQLPISQQAINSELANNKPLLLEHIKQVVGEFVGKEALPAPKPTLDINYPAISARPRNSFLPNQHWYKASDFVSGNFDPVRDFLDKLEQAGYEVTGLKIINNAKTWIIQQQDKAIKQIEKGYKHIADGLRLNNEFGMNVYGFTMGKVSY